MERWFLSCSERLNQFCNILQDRDDIFTIRIAVPVDIGILLALRRNICLAVFCDKAREQNCICNVNALVFIDIAERTVPVVVVWVVWVFWVVSVVCGGSAGSAPTS